MNQSRNQNLFKQLTTSSFLVLLVSVVVFVSIAMINNETIDRITGQLKKVNDNRPEDRVYVQLDKPFYKPGENIWFTAFVRESNFFNPSTKSDIVYVELIDPKGNISTKHTLIAKAGIAKGDFQLESNAPGGIYKVKAYTLWQENDVHSQAFIKTIQVQNVVLPRLKMKLDFLRKAYGPGETAHAELLLESLSNTPLSNKSIDFKASIQGEAYKSGKAVTNDEGKCLIAINLPETLQSTDGLLNVIISHEGNNESISRSIPITLNNIKLTFMPEGGDMVEDITSNVAFKALNEHGKPADISGYIIDDQGTKIADFKSSHNGMGKFELQAKKNRNYFAQISSPGGIEKKYELPKVLPRGYTLTSYTTKQGIRVVIGSTERSVLTLVGQMRGKLLFTKDIEVVPGQATAIIPTQSLPAGICQLTLFDHNGVARCERLLFINKERQLNIAIETDKDQYLPREEVKLKVKVSDQTGMPVPAQLALSVVDDKLLSFADDKSSNMLSYMLMEGDLKGTIEEPRFYFDPEEEKADEALDLVMLTHGWRRFTWKMVSQGLPALKNEGEQAVIAGKAYDEKENALAGVPIFVEGTDIKVITDNNGKFAIRGVDLSSPAVLRMERSKQEKHYLNVYEYQQDLSFYSYNYRHREEIMFNAMPAEAEMDAPEGGNLKGKEFEKEGAMPPLPAVVQQAKVVVMNNKQEMAPEEDLDIGFMEQEIIAEDEWIPDNDKIAKKRLFKPAPPTPKYYRAREFPELLYAANTDNEVRNDFRSTIYWNGYIEVDKYGEAQISFHNNDDISAFRITAEGIGPNGLIGRGEHLYHTQMPLAMSVKMPKEVICADDFILPVIIKNNTNTSKSGTYTLIYDDVFKCNQTSGKAQKVSVEANSFKRINIKFTTADIPGNGVITLKFNSQSFTDAITEHINVLAKGYPVAIAHSGQDLSKNMQVTINHLVPGSVKASLVAYPNVVNDLMSGIESILREPSGCFEQTSMSNYPNIMVMQYLKETEQEAPEVYAKAEGMLERGYKRLTSYETPKKGYEWFGSAPGHEALTAYGLLQFHDMKSVYPAVDDKMVDRTSSWLMSRKDGEGGFSRDPKALDNFGRAADRITNAYIVYSLSEAGFHNIDLEVETAYKQCLKDNDPYTLALIAATLFNRKDKRANGLLDQLIDMQQKDGKWLAKEHSITMSGGTSLEVETTSLAILAILKSAEVNELALNKAAKFIVSSRSSYGGFGSTQATVLALKALTSYAKYSKKTADDGILECYVEGKKVGEFHYEEGHRGNIVIENLEKYISKNGKHKIQVKFKDTEQALPYTVSIRYSTTLPPSSSACKLNLDVSLAKDRVKVGETVRLNCKLSNKEEQGQPMSMALVGIPSGCSAQAWQLKELQEKGIVDFYEIRKNKVAFYFRDMAPKESHTIHLDLKAEIAGTFSAQASSAYLYYTSEYKEWKSLPTLTIE